MKSIDCICIWSPFLPGISMLLMNKLLQQARDLHLQGPIRCCLAGPNAIAFIERTDCRVALSHFAMGYCILMWYDHYLLMQRSTCYEFS